MGTPKLLDFGVLKLLTDDTPADDRGPGADLVADAGLHASPEQLAARAAMTTASDVYSLGVLLHVVAHGPCGRMISRVGPPLAIQAQLAEAQLVLPSRRVRERHRWRAPTGCAAGHDAARFIVSSIGRSRRHCRARSEPRCGHAVSDSRSTCARPGTSSHETSRGGAAPLTRHAVAGRFVRRHARSRWP